MNYHFVETYGLLCVSTAHYRTMVKTSNKDIGDADIERFLPVIVEQPGPSRIHAYTCLCFKQAYPLATEKHIAEQSQIV